MLNKTYAPSPSQAQLRVPEVLQDGAHTWGERQTSTAFNNDHLGQVLGELFGQRRVRMGQRKDVRVYWLVDTRA